MNTFYFSLIVIGFFIFIFIALVAGVYFTNARYNNYLRKQMESAGYVVLRISSTSHRFKVPDLSEKSILLTDAPMFSNAASGSGMQFRLVKIIENGKERTVLAAVRVRFFQPVAYHLASP